MADRNTEIDELKARIVELEARPPSSDLDWLKLYTTRSRYTGQLGLHLTDRYIASDLSRKNAFANKRTNNCK